MRIDEVILTESYFDELMVAVQDLLSNLSAHDHTQVKTEKFKQLLAKQGFVTTTDELIQAIDASGFATSVDSTEIKVGGLPDEMSDIDNTVDVGSVASSQAMKDIKADL